MKADILVAILGTAGFSTIIGALITGAFSKRKLGAEATEIITKAAAGVVTNMEADLVRQRAINERLIVEHETVVAEHKVEVQNLIDRHNAEMDEARRVLQLHVAWDAIAIAKMAELGIHLPPAPPLLPDPRVLP